MSNHYGNSVIAVSPHSNRLYCVPKFGKENHTRSQSFTSPSNCSLNLSNTSCSSNPSKSAQTQSTTPKEKRLSKPVPVTPSQRSASFTSSYLASPKTIDFDPVKIDRSKSAHGNRPARTLSVIGLPSEYPLLQREESVASTFASSTTSSLVMEELDDFEAFYADETVPKVFDSCSCSSKESPLKHDRSHPPRPPAVATSSLPRARVVAPDTPPEHCVSSPPPQRPNLLNSRGISDSSVSVGSRDSLSTMSSRSRRRRNYGMVESEFEKLTEDFLSFNTTTFYITAGGHRNRLNAESFIHIFDSKLLNWRYLVLAISRAFFSKPGMYPLWVSRWETLDARMAKQKEKPKDSFTLRHHPITVGVLLALLIWTLKC
eukprot:scaffold5064_cov121-Cylindrotheca_fusiformis.AAC.8